MYSFVEIMPPIYTSATLALAYVWVYTPVDYFSTNQGLIKYIYIFINSNLNI